MPGRKKRTNPALLLLAILICLVCGGLFTQSTSTPSPITGGSIPDMFVAENVEPTPASDALTGSSDEKTESADPQTLSEDSSAEPDSAPAETKKKEPKIQFPVSPEAETGVWAPSGSQWIFLVDGTPYTGGWFTDTDGKRYYFGEDGMMKTGLIEVDGKQYYLDLDGIMQTGDVEIDGETRHFLADGALQTPDNQEAVIPATPTPAPTAEPQPTETPVPEVTDTPTPESVEETPAAESSESSEPEASETAEPELSETAEPESSEAAEPESSEAVGSESSEAAEPETSETVEPETPGSDEESPAQESAEEITITEPEAADTSQPADASVPEEKKQIAITFDDGPGDDTGRLLDCLEKNQVKATFFMTGNHISKYPDTVIRMDSLGMEIGNHSYTHPNYLNLNQTDGTAEIDGTNELLTTIIGRGAALFRPPYGTVNDLVLACSSRFPLILWSLEIPEEESQSADAIADMVLSQAEDGGIVMLHDTGSVTVDAAELFVPKLISEGYELLTVSELAEANGITLQSGIAYTSMKE